MSFESSWQEGEGGVWNSHRSTTTSYERDTMGEKDEFIEVNGGVFDSVENDGDKTTSKLGVVKQFLAGTSGKQCNSF